MPASSAALDTALVGRIRTPLILSAAVLLGEDDAGCMLPKRAAERHTHNRRSSRPRAHFTPNPGCRTTAHFDRSNRNSNSVTTRSPPLLHLYRCGAVLAPRLCNPLTGGSPATAAPLQSDGGGTPGLGLECLRRPWNGAAGENLPTTAGVRTRAPWCHGSARLTAALTTHRGTPSVPTWRRGGATAHRVALHTWGSRGGGGAPRAANRPGPRGRLGKPRSRVRTAPTPGIDCAYRRRHTHDTRRRHHFI